jgi:putative ABC transport system permease protein
MHDLIADIRYALRALRMNPSYTAIAVFCLALGIGVNTTIFSAVNAMILRPLGFRDADRIVRVYGTVPKIRVETNALSLPDLASFTNGSRSLVGAAAYQSRGFAIGSSDTTQAANQVSGLAVSWNLFQVLGIQPVLGRAFAPSDSVFGRHHVAIIGFRIWREQLNGDPAAVGKSLFLDGVQHTIVGVMPPGMRFPDRNDVWVPISLDPSKLGPYPRAARAYDVVARLAPGATVERATQELRATAAALATEFQKTNGNTSARAVPYHADMVREYDTLLWTMLGAVSFVLLIACGNVANLMLVRAAGKQKEIALRTALGATRARLVRHLLTESLLIALVAGAFGILLGVWGLDLVVAAIPYELPYWMRFDVDVRVLTYTVAISTLTGCLFGLAPALQSTRPDLSLALKDGGRGTTGGAQRSRLRSSLVVGEIALCLVLLVGATLMMRSFVRLQDVDAGFKTDGVLSAQIDMPVTRYTTPAQRIVFIDALLARLRNTPGVNDAAIVNASPLSGSSSATNYDVEGRAQIEGENLIADYRSVSADYFRTISLPVRAGRAFTAAEAADTAASVIVVNETMAKRMWPHGNGLGKRVSVGFADRWFTVIGIAADVRQRQLNQPPAPQMYLPYGTSARRTMNVLLRTPGDPAAMAPTLRAAVRATDPVVPTSEVMTLSAMRRRSMWESRVFGSMFAAFGAIALLLAAVGLYGVMSFGVAQRRHEIGVRMALGAQGADVIGLVVRQGGRLAMFGTLIGIPLAFGASRSLTSRLFGVAPTDPLSYVGIALLLSAIALLASYIPARRAVRVDPMIALRSD